MLKQRRMNCLFFLVVCLVIVSFAAGCARRTITVMETTMDPSAGVAAGQAEMTKNVKLLPIAPAIKTTPGEPTELGTSLVVREPAKPVFPVATIKEDPLREEPVKREKIQMRPVYFEFDMYGLSEEAKEIIRDHAQRLLKLSEFSLVIEGHCDERGTQEYNLALGERRAASAMKYLIALGVDEKRLRTISYGEEAPADPRSEEEAWARNRRAEFILTFK